MKTSILAGISLLALAAPAFADEPLPCSIDHVIKNEETLYVSFKAAQKLDIGEGAFFWVSPKALLAGDGKSEANPAPAIPLYITNTATQQLSDGSKCTLTAAHTQQGWGLQVNATGKDGKSSESFIVQEPAGVIRSVEIRPFFTDVYSYPRAAYDLPKLRAHFDKEIAEGRASALKQDDELLAMAAEPGGEAPSPNSSEVEWKVAGETAKLLSLKGEGYAYMGGAHGEGGNTGLLWDKSKDAAIDDVTSLFKDGLTGLRKPYCDTLTEQKKRVRGLDGPDPIGESCPEYKGLSLILTGAAGEKFSAIQIIANPYITGSFAEGTYTVTLPLTSAMLDQVNPELRDQFVEK